MHVHGKIKRSRSKQRDTSNHGTFVSGANRGRSFGSSPITDAPCSVYLQLLDLVPLINKIVNVVQIQGWVRPIKGYNVL